MAWFSSCMKSMSIDFKIDFITLTQSRRGKQHLRVLSLKCVHVDEWCSQKNKWVTLCFWVTPLSSLCARLNSLEQLDSTQKPRSHTYPTHRYALKHIVSFRAASQLQAAEGNIRHSLSHVKQPDFHHHLMNHSSLPFILSFLPFISTSLILTTEHTAQPYKL